MTISSERRRNHRGPEPIGSTGTGAKATNLKLEIAGKGNGGNFNRGVRMENFKNTINRLNNKIQYLEDEIKALKEKHHQEIQDWQKTCSMLEDEILEMQEREGV